MAGVIYVRHFGHYVKGNRLLYEQGRGISRRHPLSSEELSLSLQPPHPERGLEMTP